MPEPGWGLLSAAPAAKLDRCVMAGCMSDCRPCSANYGRVSERARGLCNWDVNEGMGGYCTLSSVSIFGCGCWESGLRRQQREDVKWDIRGTSAGRRPANLKGKAMERQAAAVAVFVYCFCLWELCKHASVGFESDLIGCHLRPIWCLP